MPRSILVVDNVVTNRILMRVRLSEAHHRVLQAETAEQALALARSDGPDLVLLSLDVSNALELCRALRAGPATAEIPIIVIGAEERRLEALQAGANACLSRPFNESLLQAHLRHLIRARQSLSDLRLREATNRAFALEEPVSPFQRRGHVALMSSRRDTATLWKAGLSGLLQDRLSLATRADAMALPGDIEVPDLFVVEVEGARQAESLRYLVELRALPATRHAAIICAIPESAPELAAMALDLGASDVVALPCDMRELAHRITTQLARKLRIDQLRNSVEDGLRLALTDPLTGLSNRRYALPHLARLTERAFATGRPLAVLLLDLDKFKQINDAFGHRAGDAVLAEIGERLRRNLRPADLAARIGGEEFLVALPESDETIAMVAAERLRQAIESTPIELPGPEGRAITVTTSIGVALGGACQPAPVAHDEAELLSRELIDRADRALYGAKAHGRNRVTLSLAAA